jgi:hypothetical protein
MQRWKRRRTTDLSLRIMSEVPYLRESGWPSGVNEPQAEHDHDDISSVGSGKLAVGAGAGPRRPILPGRDL